MSRSIGRVTPRVASVQECIKPDFDFDFGGTAAQFLRQLSPGIGVVLQYDDQRPAFGVFQGFQGGNVILTNYNGFPGLVRIAANRVNAVSPFSGFGSGFGFGFDSGFFGGGVF